MAQKSSHIILRKAAIHDMELLQHWDEQPHIIASKRAKEREGFFNNLPLWLRGSCGF